MTTGAAPGTVAAMPTPTRTAVYIRTSTDEQDGGAQRHALARTAPADAAIYEDRGESGAKVSRPAIDRLRADVRAGLVTEIHVYALDRLGRSTIAVVDLLNELTARGARVVSIREGTLDPTTPTGNFTITILAALAQMERAIIRERVKSGIERTRDPETGRLTRTKSGRPFGRTPRVDVDPAEVQRRRKAGESWRGIAQAMHAPTSTIRRAHARAVPETPSPAKGSKAPVSRASRRTR